MHDLDIWSDDVLARKEDALYLQKYIVNRYSSKKAEPGFVLAINADWGFGKSFLLNRWRKQAAIDGHPSIFFDAWQSDFTTDPLLAFIAELDSGLNQYFRMLPVGPKLTRATITAIRKAWKPALLVLGSTVLKHTAGLTLSTLSTLVEDAEQSVKVSQEELDVGDLQKNVGAAIAKALKNHNSIKKSITEFRMKLGGLISALEKSSQIQLPIIIFIDELDRCRPDYAIELLEGIKHLFGVPGVFFVVATNVKQLSESIKAVYGVGFDGQAYLKRFFDLQYLLPEPDVGEFASAIFESMALPTIDNIIYGMEELRSKPGVLIVERSPKSIFIYILGKYAEAFKLGLRDILQISTLIESALIALNFKKIHPFFLIFLAVTFHRDYELFVKMERNRALPSSERVIESGYRLELSRIEYLAYDDNGRARRNSVGLTQIADFYLSMLDTSRRDEHLRSGEYQFPKNLVDGNSTRVIQSRTKLDFEDYFSLIKHAGNFAA